MTSKYRPEIDGLRAIAVVPVLFFHAGYPHFGNGFLGVDIFFVISGYLITGILIGEGHYSLRTFYERRIRRIAPALLIVLAVTALLGTAVLTPDRMLSFGKSLLASLMFVANFWFLSQTVYMATPQSQEPLLHLWSLAVEEQFYLLFPLILWGLSKVGRRLTWVVLAMLAMLSLAYSQYLTGGDPNAAFFRPDTRAWQLLIGSLCALAPVLPTRVQSPLGLVGLVLVVASYFALPASVAPTAASLPVCIGTGLIVLGARQGNVAGRLLSLKPLVWIGLISYSLYLWHQPLLALARIYNFGTLPVWASAGILVASTLLAYLSWRFIETPARKRSIVSISRLGSGVAVAACLLAAVSITSMATNGMAFRYGDRAALYFASMEKIDQIGSERTQAIRMGTCHYRVDLTAPISDFIKKWDCFGDQTGRGILVVGDSHGADLAAGFRLNGMEIGQMTGAGCGLAPSKMIPECKQMFAALKRHPGRFRVIVFGNDQTSRIYNKVMIDETLAYWKQFGLPIVWFSDLPQFPELEDRKTYNILHFGTAKVANYPVTTGVSRWSANALRKYAQSRYEVIDSGQIYCEISSPDHCLPYGKGGFLALIKGHLTALGARLFMGEAMKRHPEILFR